MRTETSRLYLGAEIHPFQHIDSFRTYPYFRSYVYYTHFRWICAGEFMRSEMIYTEASGAKRDIGLGPRAPAFEGFRGSRR